LEALASGTPVAAFPVSGPRDVIGQAPVGVLNDNLAEACRQALRISRQDCLEFAARHTWEASARAFIENMADFSRFGLQSDAAPLMSEQPRFVA
jgi:glycosyltransferase involved in cell wall biosynthesis